MNKTEGMPIESYIVLIRQRKVIIDHDLARLYGVETKHLKRQVRRNIERFPDEFMFQLTAREKDELVTNWHQFSTLKHSYQRPFAFTEHGVAMLATVLKSERAIKLSIAIIKIFVRMREMHAMQKDLAHKLGEIEKRIENHDTEIRTLFEAIRQLLEPPPAKPKPRIGFRPLP